MFNLEESTKFMNILLTLESNLNKYDFDKMQFNGDSSHYWIKFSIKYDFHILDFYESLDSDNRVIFLNYLLNM